jgi:hypothetical protein
MSYVVMLKGQEGQACPIGPFDTQDEACDYLTGCFDDMGKGCTLHGVKVLELRVVECLTPIRLT